MSFDGDFENAQNDNIDESQFVGMTKSTYGSLKKGSVAMLKMRPCKILEVSTGKTGKHGAAKTIVKGSDLITDKIVVTSSTTTGTVWLPLVERKTFNLIDLQEDYVSVQDETGNMFDYKINLDDEHGKFISENKTCDNLVLTMIFVIGEHRVIDTKLEK
jgi:translation initiation factor 5A